MSQNISKAASIMGQKSAEVNKKKGKKYFSDLANKRWDKERKKKDGLV
jgi:hypothetical protein